ncbi:outer membrane beta-barrel protein [Flavobacterium croceum]|uniref:Outer membrane protein with beta-barrel domain n=1 Tax=Flavobacterium croceum DSM 17960 TaxID=1121886 RepID=A0A2S4N8M8_9FLAO|nr:outer membrane beta-barrel protein [Flavobacterium croceum]POS02046.1 outer membrane protein with beta-barrel domain [Flavobacterium croceum DSM 17960]
MKKLFVLAGIALLSLTANAQEKKAGLQGAWFATAQIGYSQTKQGDAKATNTTILPIVGTFVAPTTAVGLGFGSIGIKNEDKVGTNANTNLIVVQPLVRKYWGVANNFYFFGQLAAPIITGKEKESDLKVSQYGLSMSGGLDFFVTKNFSVEFSYNLANFSQTTLTPKAGDKTTVTDFSVAHVASVESGYNGALGGSNPTLTTPLSFGFKFVF